MRLKYNIILIFIFLFIISLVSAEMETVCKEISFFDQNNQLLVNYVVSIETNGETVVEKSLDFNGKITLCNISENEDYFFTIKSLMDDRSYFAHILTPVNYGYLELNALPVANIYGIVLDSYNNLVSSADLNFQCQESLSELTPLKTNDFGVFSLENIPLGNCVILTKYKEQSGFEILDLKDNRDYHLTIRLSNEEKYFSMWWLVLIGFLLVVLIGVIINVKHRFLQKNELYNENQITKKIHMTSNMNNLMKTFNDSELKIVDFLIQEGGCASQTKIRKNTLIPKTSLHRYIKSLEQKTILKTFSIGKINKIELSEFFLK